MKLNSPEELINDIKLGKMVVLMDDEDRENEGDLVIAAGQVRAEDINFMATHGRGLICLTLTGERCDLLKLPLMVDDNSAQFSTNFTVSIEAAKGVTTGISAADRAHTVRAAVASTATADDIVQPGHIFPLRAQTGGVLNRAGHTEAGCDLARLAGLEPASVIVEIMNDDGTMARRPDLEKFAELHDIKIGTISDLINYRLIHEKTVEKVREDMIQTDYGEFLVATYRDTLDGVVHAALIKGDIDSSEPTVVRVHMPDVRDLLRVNEKDSSHWQFHHAMKYLSNQESGVIVLLNPGHYSNDAISVMQQAEIYNKLKSAEDGNLLKNRTIGTGSQILVDLGVSKMRLLSAPMKFNALSGFNLEVVEYIPFDQNQGI